MDNTKFKQDNLSKFYRDFKESCRLYKSLKTKNNHKVKHFMDTNDTVLLESKTNDRELKKRVSSIKLGKAIKRTEFLSSENPSRYDSPLHPCSKYIFVSKPEIKLPSIPGPGYYDPKLVKPNVKKVFFGTEPRKDNFLDLEQSFNPSPCEYTIKSRSSSPKWKFGSESRTKELDISKLGVYDALLQIRLKKSLLPF